MSMLSRRLGAFVGTTAVAALGLVGATGSAAVTADAVSFSYTGDVQTYTVPSDGSVCAVTLDAAGANGGNGDFVNGVPFSFGTGDADAQFLGGTGGGASATYLVAPGDVITVLVGGAGGPGGGGSQVGGFGGGGDGGNGDGGIGGGGGGGASGFVVGTQPLLVAGGGGGGGAVVQDGGAGGSAGGDGAAGVFNGAPGSGGAGGGGTATTGGIGGFPGQPFNGATAGAAGAALAGGAGGSNGGSLAGGGGGGGGGWFGGGGGGGAARGASGGGGGGGSSHVAPSVGTVSAGSLGQDADGNGAATITPIGPACNVLSIDKVVHGVVPAGATFRVHAECTTGEQSDIVFDEAGAPVSSHDLLVGGGVCTVTETDAGGAVSTSYACSETPVATPPHCDPRGQQIAFDDATGRTATVTITNVFPAAVEVIAPRFTG